MNIFGVLVIIILVILVIAVAIILWIINGQKKLVATEELCGNALSQIGIQQASRWDALTALADLTKEYSTQEYDVLMDVIRARQGIDAKSPAQKVDNQEAMIQQATSKLSAVAEAYPDLKSNTLYLKMMDSVQEYDNNVRMSRMVYNDTITKYNRLVRTFPGTVIAGSLGFAPREYLQADDSKAEMPTVTR